MKAGNTLMAACAALALGAGAALADCAQELAAFETEMGDGIAKDGSLAPLQEQAGAEPGAVEEGAGFEAAAGEAGTETGAVAEGAGEVAKEGALVPLEEQAGDTPEGLAMSQQDAEAQQEGAPTATEAATAEAGPGDDAARDEALERARMALAQGDEAACMAALEEARSL